MIQLELIFVYSVSCRPVLLLLPFLLLPSSARGHANIPAQATGKAIIPAHVYVYFWTLLFYSLDVFEYLYTNTSLSGLLESDTNSSDVSSTLFFFLGVLLTAVDSLHFHTRCRISM